MNALQWSGFGLAVSLVTTSKAAQGLLAWKPNAGLSHISLLLGASVPPVFRPCDLVRLLCYLFSINSQDHCGFFGRSAPVPHLAMRYFSRGSAARLFGASLGYLFSPSCLVFALTSSQVWVGNHLRIS